MRRRLMLVLLPLLAALLGALCVILAQTYADRLTQELFLKRSAAAESFAAAADPVLRTGLRFPALAAEIDNYTRAVVPGATVRVYDSDKNPVYPRTTRASARVLTERDASLAEAPGGAPKTAWPWHTTPMIVGKTIGSPTIGAVVVQSPTATVRGRIQERMILLAAGGIAALLLASALWSLPLARWLLRPVHDLNTAAERLAAGDLAARASERGGPPELRGLAQAFNQMADYLVAALQGQRAFVADASHELRNPLATLRLRMEALDGKVGEGGERDLRLALAESDRLAHTVKRLLELARAEATAAEQADVDVVALTAKRLDAWRTALDEAGSDLCFDAPAPIAVRCSPEAVEYALDVVLDNARTFADGAPVDVAITAQDGVEIVVRDHGPGLPADELTHAGERFWRSGRHRARAGTGLGLATARALLEGSGASMTIAGTDPGLEVRLRLAPSTGSLRDTSASRQDEAPADTSRSPSAGSGA